MEEYIIKLLNENLRIIIPGFGAFIVRQKEPKVIVFNEFIRYDDGLLIDYLSRQEGIDKDVALQQVAAFSEEAVKLLDEKKSLVIKGLGTLTRDSSGKVLFESLESSDASTDGTDTLVGSQKQVAENNDDGDKDQKTKSIQEKENNENDVKDEEKDIDLPQKPGRKKKVVPISKAKTETVKRTKPKSSADLTKKETANNYEEPSISEKENQSVLEDSSKIKLIEDKPSLEETVKKPVDSLTDKENKKNIVTSSDHVKAEAKPSEEKKSSNVNKTDYITPHYTNNITAVKAKKNINNQILLWIAVILIVNLAILAWFNYGENIKSFFAGTKTEDTDILVTEESASTNEDLMNVVEEFDESPSLSVSELDEVPQEQVLQPIVSPSGQAKYYIVAGCFREEANANELVNSLNNKGYKAEKFGRIGNLHAVSYASFGNREDAVSELERIRQEEQPDAWMTRY